MKNKNIKNLPLVSVIMNCHNGEKYLNKSLKSLLSQTYLNWELIFFDNNSSDKSKIIIKKYHDKRFKYFYSKKLLSLYKARNEAIKKAKGHYISFLDTDDYWVKNKIEKQVNFFFRYPKLKIVYSNYYVKNQTKKIIYLKYKNLLPFGYISKFLLRDYCIGILTVCLKKSIFNKLKFNNNYNIIGDFDFFMNLSINEKIGSIQEPLAYYRVHNDSLSKIYLKTHLYELKSWLKNIKNNKLKKLNFFYLKFYILKLKVKYSIKKILNI